MSSSQEVAKQVPETKEVPMEELEAIMKTISFIVEKMEGKNIKGNAATKFENKLMRYKEGNFTYLIAVEESVKGDGYKERNNRKTQQHLVITKETKDSSGKDMFLGTIRIQIEQLNSDEFGRDRDCWTMYMTFSEKAHEFPGKVIATAKHQDSLSNPTYTIKRGERVYEPEYKVENGHLIKEKADKFLKVYTDYITDEEAKPVSPKKVIAPKPATPKAVREF